MGSLCLSTQKEYCSSKDFEDHFLINSTLSYNREKMELKEVKWFSKPHVQLLVKPKVVLGFPIKYELHFFCFCLNHSWYRMWDTSCKTLDNIFLGRSRKERIWTYFPPRALYLTSKHQTNRISRKRKNLCFILNLPRQHLGPAISCN